MVYENMVSELDRQHYNNPDGDKSWRGLKLSRIARFYKTTEAEVLRAMHEVASRDKLRFGEINCKSCGMPITFRNQTPFDRSRKNHFIACPNRKAHRRKK